MSGYIVRQYFGARIAAIVDKVRKNIVYGMLICLLTVNDYVIIEH